MPVSRWKRFRYRLEWLLCSGIAWAVPKLPRRYCAAFADGAGALAYRIDGRGRAVAEANLRCAFGDRYDDAQRARIARKSYQNFARTMFDLFWGRNLTPENWREFIEIGGGLETFLFNSGAHGPQGPENTQGRQGAVLMCTHWGNFEWASLAVGFLGIRTIIVAEKFKNPHLGPVFNGAREVSGHTIIPQENSMIRLLKVVKRRGMAGMLVDLTLRPDQAAVAVRAFGRPMSATFLHGVLALRGGALLVPVHGESLPDGRCRVTFDPPLPVSPDATPAQLAQQCWDHFVPHIEARPELWMWAYKHWRYRPRDAAPETYPFYSNVSGKFEKLLAAQPAPAKKRRQPPPAASENGGVN